jgi:hypothetical protein
MSTQTDSVRLEVPAKAQPPVQPAAPQQHMDRRAWDRIVSSAGAVLAVILLVLGGAAIYGGNFGQDNVRDRLAPQNISFPPTDAMTPEELALVGDFAGAKVDTGSEAEAFSRYIGLHLSEVNGGATYSETSAAAREEGLDPTVAADLQFKADTLFKGETLRSILLNAYGWWTVSTIAVYAGYAMVIAGLLLGLLTFLGFRHAKRAAPINATA